MDIYPLYVLFVILSELVVILLTKFQWNERLDEIVYAKYIILFSALQTPILTVWTLLKLFKVV